MVCYRAEYAGGWKYQCIDSHIATDLDSLMHERFIIGGLAQCVAPMRRFVDVFEVTHLICRWFFPGKLPPYIMREPKLLAREGHRGISIG